MGQSSEAFVLKRMMLISLACKALMMACSSFEVSHAILVGFHYFILNTKCNTKLSDINSTKISTNVNVGNACW
jgi:hypothetical protein